MCFVLLLAIFAVVTRVCTWRVDGIERVKFYFLPIPEFFFLRFDMWRWNIVWELVITCVKMRTEDTFAARRDESLDVLPLFWTLLVLSRWMNFYFMDFVSDRSLAWRRPQGRVGIEELVTLHSSSVLPRSLLARDGKMSSGQPSTERDELIQQFCQITGQCPYTRTCFCSFILKIKRLFSLKKAPLDYW
jgi:hypothetical protein